MAYKNKKEANDKPRFDLAGMTVQNVRVLSETTLAFSLTGKGLGLYNLRVVDGERGKFVAVPQTKGRDGKWYNQYALYLTADDEKKLIADVEAKLQES